MEYINTENTYFITIDKELIHEYHTYYMKSHPKARTLPFTKAESVKQYNKDGNPILTSGGKQKTKKTSISKKNYTINDCLYGVMSLNELLVIKNRMVMNQKKQNWGDLGVWIAEKYNLSNLKISNCLIEYRIYGSTKANRDNDNIAGGIKFLNDGLYVKSGMLLDDNYNILNPLIINCDYDKEHPRTEIRISVFDNDVKNIYDKTLIHINNFKDIKIS